MEGEKKAGKRGADRPGLLGISGLLVGIMLVGLWTGHIPAASAEDVYPSDKIRWIIPLLKKYLDK